MGIMMNNTVLKMNGINPVVSKPAILIDHKLNFYGENGMAEAIESKGSQLHGVCHLLGRKEMLLI